MTTKMSARKIVDHTDILTIKEVAQRLKVSPVTVYRWVHIGYIPYTKLGGNIRFMWSTVSDWMTSRNHPGRHDYLPPNFG